MEKHFDKVSFKFKIWLETVAGEGVLGEGKYILLKTIEETGSLKQAIEILGLSYRKTWDKLRKIEDTLGFHLIERQRGGASGGSSGLTNEGKRFVQVFGSFEEAYGKQVQDFLDEMTKELREPL